MGGRGTYASGRNVPFVYKTVGLFHGVKVLEGTEGKHGLPEEAHTSEAYVKLARDGNLLMLRFYDKDKFLTTEIGFHPEPKLTGHHRPVYHIHFYDRDFKRTEPRLLIPEEIKKYERFFTVKGAFQ